MLLYNRDTTPASSLSNIKKELDDLKSMQLVGSDNIVVFFYFDFIPGPISISANTRATFKGEFTFDEPPVETFVPITFFWLSSSAFSYFDYRYNAPETINSKTSQAFYISLIPDSNIDLDFMEATAKSTSRGTLNLTRTE